MQRYLLHEQGHWKLVGLWCASSEEMGWGAAEVTLVQRAAVSCYYPVRLCTGVRVCNPDSASLAQRRDGALNSALTLSLLCTACIA